MILLGRNLPDTKLVKVRYRAYIVMMDGMLMAQSI